ncbi:MAG: hypothetical protein AB7F82_06565 [Alphaproteobacteria bacterium]
MTSPKGSVRKYIAITALYLCVALPCVAAVVEKTPASGKWPLPELQNPITIDVTDDSPPGLTQRLDTSKDYIIRFGKVTRESITITGGRNIFIEGGQLVRPADTPASDSRTGKRLKHHGVMLGVSGHTGTFYADGLLIDANEQYGVDAIAVGAPPGKPAGDHIFQNIHIRGVQGTSKGLHADGLQAVGTVNTLWLHNVTIVTGCQGIVIAPFWPLADVRLSNVNLRYTDPDYRNGKANGFLLWLGNGENTREQIDSARYTFENVYVAERTH